MNYLSSGLKFPNMQCLIRPLFWPAAELPLASAMTLEYSLCYLVAKLALCILHTIYIIICETVF